VLRVIVVSLPTGKNPFAVQINNTYTNNFGGTKLKRNYIWGYANKEAEYHRTK
jgi:hypothetical protein